MCAEVMQGGFVESSIHVGVVADAFPMNIVKR